MRTTTSTASSAQRDQHNGQQADQRHPAAQQKHRSDSSTISNMFHRSLLIGIGRRALVANARRALRRHARKAAARPVAAAPGHPTSPAVDSSVTGDAAAAALWPKHESEAPAAAAVPPQSAAGVAFAAAPCPGTAAPLRAGPRQTGRAAAQAALAPAAAPLPAAPPAPAALRAPAAAPTPAAAPAVAATSPAAASAAPAGGGDEPDGPGVPARAEGPAVAPSVHQPPRPRRGPKRLRQSSGAPTASPTRSSAAVLATAQAACQAEPALADPDGDGAAASGSAAGAEPAAAAAAASMAPAPPAPAEPARTASAAAGAGGGPPGGAEAQGYEPCAAPPPAPLEPRRERPAPAAPQAEASGAVPRACASTAARAATGPGGFLAAQDWPGPPSGGGGELPDEELRRALVERLGRSQAPEDRIQRTAVRCRALFSLPWVAEPQTPAPTLADPPADPLAEPLAEPLAKKRPRPRAQPGQALAEPAAAAPRPWQPLRAAPVRVRPEPPLPAPGQDFPVYTDGDTGLEHRGDRVWCSFCDVEVRGSEADHLAARRHRGSSETARSASRLLCEQGHRLWREGIAVSMMKASCALCHKEGADWWEFFSQFPLHQETRWHVRCRSWSDLRAPARAEAEPREAAPSRSGPARPAAERARPAPGERALAREAEPREARREEPGAPGTALQEREQE
ncbi:unnamed protein product [Prorocentrum cordatum]|uniref:C2H2-type domain-containing protein n=1 Tax=Prorocentrum cordatum TaxID=2364126 RepID=A0ABN9WHR8_9DINO|nr:unnamed protein product [Polarella glacialis]